jgi:dolichol-phosphate mannosyltransferase
MYLSIIIPCYNEADVIEETYTRLTKIAISITKEFELIFVNDGSTDATDILLSELSNNDKNIKVLNNTKNIGQQSSILSALKICTGHFAVIIDCDLQDPPELIPEMIQICTTKTCDVVYGVRVKRFGESVFKKLSAYIFYRISYFLTRGKIQLDTGEFRLINKSVVKNINLNSSKVKLLRFYFSKMNVKQEPLYYEREKRFAGYSKYNALSMFKLALSAIQ